MGVGVGRRMHNVEGGLRDYVPLLFVRSTGKLNFLLACLYMSVQV